MLSFRYATLADVDYIVSLVESAYRGEPSRAGWTTEADLLDGQRTDADEVSKLINQPDSCIYLCEQKEAIVASVHLLNKTHYAYLGMFAVSPVSQGCGIGKQLLRAAESLAFDEWRCPSIRMTVISLRKELLDWYYRRGYQATGEFEPFPYGNIRYGIPRRDDLVLEVLEKMAG